MPILILARGAGGQGKTSAIKRVLEKIGVRFQIKSADINIALPGYWVDGRFRSTSIALASGGDTKSVVEGNLKFFEESLSPKGLPAIMIMGCKSKTDGAEPYQETLKFVEKHKLKMIAVPFKRQSGENKEAYFDRMADEILSKIP